MRNTPNLGYLFNYKYFRDERLQALDWKELLRKNKGSERDKKEVSAFFAVKNKEITRHQLDDYTSTALSFLSEKSEDGQFFYLKTMYPGLLVGAGYIHETNLLNELKLGFFFDHTSGLPVIPGSSVKGALRSPFIDAPGFVLELWENIRAANEADPKKWPRLNLAQIAALELQIFGSRAKQNSSSEGSKGKDIFHDAFVVLPKGEQEKKLLGNDFITPHINRKDRALDAFTDPVPLQFLKVLPEVSFRFQFELSDGILGKAQKLELFRHLILNLGVGAKTNVGYGQFKD